MREGLEVLHHCDTFAPAIVLATARCGGRVMRSVDAEASSDRGTAERVAPAKPQRPPLVKSYDPHFGEAFEDVSRPTRAFDERVFDGKPLAGAARIA